MSTGVVKWFNKNKGFGFITPEGGGSDVFVHISALKEANLSDLNEGERVGFELENKNGKTSAINLKVL